MARVTIELMMKRTIKPAAGKSNVTAAAAKAAARVVYRDAGTGRLIVMERREKTSAAASKSSPSRKR